QHRQLPLAQPPLQSFLRFNSRAGIDSAGGQVGSVRHARSVPAVRPRIAESLPPCCSALAIRAPLPSLAATQAVSPTAANTCVRRESPFLFSPSFPKLAPAASFSS